MVGMKYYPAELLRIEIPENGKKHKIETSACK
jgi:hypothetical protein